MPALNYILEQFADAGYDCHYKVLNSKDFDVPQNRERIFIVGFRKNLNIAKNYVFPQGQETTKVLNDVLEKDVPESYFHSEKSMKYINGSMKGETTTRFEKYGSSYNKISRCLFAIIYKGAPYNVVLDSNGRHRRYLTRELARLQGYPEDFKLHPVKTHAYKQLGNSVTVPVVQAIMKSVQERL